MLANSIEGNSSSKAQLELENASDEEEKFSAVVRPNHGSSSGGGSSEQTRERRDYRDFGERTRSSLGAGGTSANSSGGSPFTCTPCFNIFLTEYILFIV